jgi:hypothetical protein
MDLAIGSKDRPTLVCLCMVKKQHGNCVTIHVIIVLKKNTKECRLLYMRKISIY